MWYFSAIIIGFLGSFHCAGMCGPIALALPGSSKFITGRILYNIGRISTYTILGLIAGLVGHSIMISGFQKYLSIISGLVILIMVFPTLVFQKERFNGKFIYAWTNQIKLWFKKLFTLRTKLTYLWIGGVNGLLPCGMVYLALIASLSGQNRLDGMAYMLLFGIGTLPMMILLSFTGMIAGKKYATVLKRITPIISIAMAIFLIGRGILIENDSCCHH